MVIQKVIFRVFTRFNFVGQPYEPRTTRVQNVTMKIGVPLRRVKFD